MTPERETEHMRQLNFAAAHMHRYPNLDHNRSAPLITAGCELLEALNEERTRRIELEREVMDWRRLRPLIQHHIHSEGMTQADAAIELIRQLEKAVQEKS